MRKGRGRGKVSEADSYLPSSLAPRHSVTVTVALQADPPAVSQRV
jgi:hypothetical protein